VDLSGNLCGRASGGQPQSLQVNPVGQREELQRGHAQNGSELRDESNRWAPHPTLPLRNPFASGEIEGASHLALSHPGRRPSPVHRGTVDPSLHGVTLVRGPHGCATCRPDRSRPGRLRPTRDLTGLEPRARSLSETRHLVSVHLGRRVVLIQSMKTDDLLTAVDTESTPPHPPPQEPLPVTCAVECLPGLVVAPRYALPTGTLGLLADLVLASARAKGGKTEAA